MASPEDSTADRSLRSEYAAVSVQPLHILIFLTPLVALYEIGSALYLTDPNTGVVRETIRAHLIFSRLFELFGVGGAMLPGILMVVVLFIWHLLARDSWRVRPAVLGMMVVESAALTLPLIVLGQAAGLFALAATVEPVERSFGAVATISVGAGLYEELLFRMIGIALVHFILVDLMSMKETPARLIAIGVSALAFAVYHDQWTANFIFLMVAGLYFGGLYVYRGFGIVVATHALYDLIVLGVAHAQ